MLHMNGQEVSEERIFECYGNIHVYCLVVGADEPLGSNFFIVIDIVLLPISCKIFPLTFLQFFCIGNLCSRFLKGSYHIWAWLPCWSCDLDYLYTHWFPLPIDAYIKFGYDQRRRELKM